jgi:hypothetical protein
MFRQYNSPNIIQPLFKFSFGLKGAFVSLCWSARAYFNSLCYSILENNQVTTRRGRNSTKHLVSSVDKISANSQFASSSYSDSIYSLSLVGTGNVRTFVSRMLAAILGTVFAPAWSLEGKLTLLTNDGWHTTFDSSLVRGVA